MKSYFKLYDIITSCRCDSVAVAAPFCVNIAEVISVVLVAGVIIADITF